MNNITQYGTLFVAFGCKLNYDSLDVKLKIADDASKNTIIKNVLADIDKFDDCANYMDGAAALCLADYVDNEPNPLSNKVRENVLSGLGIKKDNKFIYQVLSLQKNNRSWHNSTIPSECEHFGEVCTHRGINHNPDRKGRHSSRQPEDYHILNSRGIIAREQLVTPALELFFQKIPEGNLVSGKTFISFDNLDLKSLVKLNLEEKLKLLTELQASI